MIRAAAIAFLIAASPALAQPSQPTVTMAGFWAMCDVRQPDGRRGYLCTGYVLGVVDSLTSLAEGRPNLALCHQADALPALVERVITYVPTLIRDDSRAVYQVQLAVMKAAACK